MDWMAVSLFSLWEQTTMHMMFSLLPGNGFSWNLNHESNLTFSKDPLLNMKKSNPLYIYVVENKMDLPL